MPSFADRLLRRRQGLNDIVGINGGTLQDQLDEDRQGQSPDRMSGVPSTQAQPTMADKYMATAQPVQPLEENRPRQVNPFQQRLMSGRARVADPTGFDSEHLRELEATKDPRWERILNATAAGVASAAQGGAPIKAIPTRRERDIQTVQGRLGQDIAVGREQAQIANAKSQQDAREANILAAQERIRQGDERIQQGGARLDQQATNERRSRLISQHTGLKEFDPDDPKNTGFVAAWTKEFGYPPAKKTSGSLLQYRQGYDANGNVIAEVLDKGTGQTAQAQGSNIVQTEQGANRTQQQSQFETREQRIREINTLNRDAAIERVRLLISGRGGSPEDAGALADKLDDEIAKAQNGSRSDRQQVPRLQALSNQARLKASEWRRQNQIGQAPQVSTQPSSTGRKWDENRFIDGFKAKYKRVPTQKEIEANRR